MFKFGHRTNLDLKKNNATISKIGKPNKTPENGSSVDLWPYIQRFFKPIVKLRFMLLNEYWERTVINFFQIVINKKISGFWRVQADKKKLT